jgi:hypothetical protein
MFNALLVFFGNQNISSKIISLLLLAVVLRTIYLEP